jgi:hypothetical protein
MLLTSFDTASAVDVPVEQALLPEIASLLSCSQMTLEYDNLPHMS